MPAAVPLMQHSPGTLLALKQLLKQSTDAQQRAICGRPPAADLCPMAALHALNSAHMKLMQDH